MIEELLKEHKPESFPNLYKMLNPEDKAKEDPELSFYWNGIYN